MKTLRRKLTSEIVYKFDFAIGPKNERVFSTNLYFKISFFTIKFYK